MIITNDELSIIKLIDFSIINPDNSDEARIDRKGSVYWMSPEMFDDISEDPRSDIWALGCTMIEMVLI